MSTAYCVVFITTPTGKKARDIAARILKERLAACVNTIARVDSTYWWKGKIESAAESLLVIKTRRAHVKRLTQLIKKIHPYTVPEVISVPITAGHKPYLAWLRQET